MGIVLTLRNESNLSYFKEFMLGLLALKVGNKALICSGYFQEDYTPSKSNPGNKFKATQEINIDKKQF